MSDLLGEEYSGSDDEYDLGEENDDEEDYDGPF